MPEYKLCKKDYFVEYYMGTEYEIGHPKTIGELHGLLKLIVEDIGSIGDDLQIENVEFDRDKNTIRFYLTEGIIQ